MTSSVTAGFVPGSQILLQSLTAGSTLQSILVAQPTTGALTMASSTADAANGAYWQVADAGQSVTYNGQTLGMQVWGVRIQNRDGTAIDLWQALLRFFIAIGSWLFGGLGFLWMLWDKDRLTWHDRYSESVVVQLPKRKKN